MSKGKGMSETSYQLSLLKIPVSEISRSAEFYRDILGFSQQSAAEEYGWAQLQAGDLSVALYKPGMGGGTGQVGGSTGFHLCLPPERFDQMAADLLKRGVLVDNMVHQSDEGGVFIGVSDPDGNVIKIMPAAGM